MNNNFLHHFLEIHGLTNQFLQEEELYLQDKTCAYAHEDTSISFTVGTWKDCEDARSQYQFNGFIIREATQEEKARYELQSL